MLPERHQSDESARIGQELRRLATSEFNRRHLAELPVFHVEQEMPRKLKDLLEALKAAERVPGRG
jgi:hypothetical protein